MHTAKKINNPAETNLYYGYITVFDYYQRRQRYRPWKGDFKYSLANRAKYTYHFSYPEFLNPARDGLVKAPTNVLSLAPYISPV